MAKENLIFTQTKDGWVSEEFSVSSDFNVHISSNNGGSATVYVNTAGEGFTKAAYFQLTPDPKHVGRFVGEADCVGKIYDKNVIVIVSVSPISGIITEG